MEEALAHTSITPDTHSRFAKPFIITQLACLWEKGGGEEEEERREEGVEEEEGRSLLHILHKYIFTFAPHFAAASVSSVTPLSKSGSTYSIPGVYKLQTTCTQLWNGMEYCCGMEWSIGMEWNAATSDYSWRA